MSVSLVDVECGVTGCGVTFGLRTGFQRRMRNTGDWFWCPNGHRICYCESENERLKVKVGRLTASNDQLRAAWFAEEELRKATERSRSRYKGELTKYRNKIVKGECPLCGTTFKGVRRHIQRKHPELMEDLRKAATR